MQNNENNTWLCRNCNTLISNEIDTCPSCNALRPEVEAETTPAPEGIASEIVMERYSNTTPQEAKYTFMESVLTTSADIMLALGLFLTLGAFIAPAVIEHDLPRYTAMMISIATAVVIFATTMISWALLRVIADISRRSRDN
ncbi:MAG: hypothetical protein J6V26_03435 [Alistipes sp.]|nr:hypothetical protein [Alistipes sp.]